MKPSLLVLGVWLVFCSGCDVPHSDVHHVTQEAGDVLNPDGRKREAEVARRASETALNAMEAAKTATAAAQASAEAAQKAADAAKQAAKAAQDAVNAINQIRISLPTPAPEVSTTPKP